ncbi:polysaccharide deacetylase family protein [uncultured Maribacter sp.]|uniref:polysaccharide deacetylase family protein n=1 Tax=uncultured Maribacter sp. TaxID=431308 RepID=UPI00262D04B0|nr:polysaccharide deacetylase family protein [uncultured Maribacter sp.]
MKKIITLLLLIPLSSFSQSKISFTFDDGSLRDKPNHTLDQWNSMLLQKLRDARVEAMFFVSGEGKTGYKGKQLLKSWNNDGHKIANHTFNHLNYNNKTHTFEAFKDDFIKNDTIINTYSNYCKFFRFPYLKEGNTEEKITAAKAFLKEQNYRNGYVTIDNSDWYIESRLVKRLKDNPNADISDFKTFYLNHIWERAQFYEKLSLKINGRHINHSLLLHHNLAAALFIDDLINMFISKGWKIVSASNAYKDPVYLTETKFSGESLIYALAKDSGKYDTILRATGEDSKSIKIVMNKLGL